MIDWTTPEHRERRLRNHGLLLPAGPRPARPSAPSNLEAAAEFFLKFGWPPLRNAEPPADT